MPLGLHGPAFRADEMGPAGRITSRETFDLTGDWRVLHHTSSTPPSSTLLVLGPAVPGPPIQKADLASRRSCPPLDILAIGRKYEKSRTNGDPVGDTAPDFTAETTEGRLSLHEYLGDSREFLFSHPADFTPVCTTELGDFARRNDEFTKRNTKLISVSVDPVESHRRWSDDIAETQGQGLNYPLVGDEDRTVANPYGMIHPQALEAATGHGTCRARQRPRPQGEPHAHLPGQRGTQRR